MAKMMTDDLLEDIRNEIVDSDKLLIGIGCEWQQKIEVDYSYLSGKKDGLMLDEIVAMNDIKMVGDKEQLLVLYQKLKCIIKDKDYYIISLCDDDVIYDIFEDGENVVTPCGGYRLLQCGQHIMSRDEVMINNGKPVCPVCGGDLSYNNIMNEKYMEESYLHKFEDYKRWLQSTINKKLVILELGADMKLPQVVRFAFDRLVKFNLKSKMYRVNKSICMVDASAEGRGVAVNCDSMELVYRMK